MSDVAAPRFRVPPGWIPWTYAYVAMVAAFITLVVVLSAGGGAPHTPPAGVPDPGVVTGWGIPVLRLTSDLGGMVAAGGLLVFAFLLTRSEEDFAEYGVHSRRCSVVSTSAMGASALALIPLTLSEFVGRPVTEVGVGDVADFALHTEQGFVLLLQGVVALCVAIVLSRPLSRRAAVGVLAVLVGAIALVPAFTGHSFAAEDHRSLAVCAVALHVVAATLWVGGLIGLALVVRSARPLLSDAVTRFSSLALGCVAVLLISGVVNAALKLESWGLLVTDWYGRLVIAKVLALALLSGIGFIHRQRTIPAMRRGDRYPLLRLAGAEILLMAMTVGLAVGLARTPGG